MRRAFAWLLLILGAFLVLAGLIDMVVGPELAEQEPGVAAGEGGSRWYGMIYVMIGIALAAFGHRLGRRPTKQEFP